ncbi:hypothetical protein VP1G_00839 [Cytospora mali]|uniref:Uncharacterized protein n=1 Tax=Cytospora mali TaxID=578113 RepID=A0A194UP68_CYTMA|nr:hypothetical protein VP1G_00839 [Valsa mali var. pyri (nom. inval.)]
MFLHSGASLHGHEFSGNNRQSQQSPISPPQQRRKPYLRSAFAAAPMLRSTSFAGTDAQPPQTPKARTRPVSELYVRPISDLLEGPKKHVRSPTTPVVRFKEPEILETPKTSVTEDEPSLYDSDASQTSSAVRRRRKRASTLRKSTNYLLAKPAPKLGSKKHLLKHMRPRLLLQLQELPAGQRRPRPTIDVFPASLIAGPLVTARYIHRFPRIFGVKCELGPRDLILVKSEDYDTGLSESEEDDENVSGRREPVAVLSPVRGLDCDEIVLDDGTVWTARPNPKGGFDFVHVDKHGLTLTARWVKRNPAKSSPTTPSSRPLSPAPSFTSPTTNGSSPVDPIDYRYTFSIINPLSRRHPILATLTQNSLEVYDEFTTVSSSQGRHPPTRPKSHNFDSAPNKASSTERLTQPVDEATKKLIMVSGLWLALRLGERTTIAAAAPEPSETGETPPYAKESFMCMQTRTDAGKLPRRQTTSNASSTTPSIPAQSLGMRRAMSTGAAFMQRRMRHSHSHASEDSSDSHYINNYNYYNNTAAMVLEMDEMSGGGDGGAGMANNNESRDAQQQRSMPASTPAPAPAPAQQEKQQKQSRRVSWLKKLKH